MHVPLCLVFPRKGDWIDFFWQKRNWTQHFINHNTLNTLWKFTYIVFWSWNILRKRWHWDLQEKSKKQDWRRLRGKLTRINERIRLSILQISQMHQILGTFSPTIIAIANFPIFSRFSTRQSTTWRSLLNYDQINPSVLFFDSNMYLCNHFVPFLW